MRRLFRKNPIIFGLVVANLLIALFWSATWFYSLLTKPTPLQVRTKFYQKAYVPVRVFSALESDRFAGVRERRSQSWNDGDLTFVEQALGQSTLSSDPDIQTLREFLLIRTLTAKRQASGPQRARIARCLQPLLRPETDRHRVENVDRILKYLQRSSDTASRDALQAFSGSGGLAKHQAAIVATGARVLPKPL